MPNKPLKDLYEEFNPKLNIANTYEEFESIMNDPKNRESFFNDFNSELNLAKDYKEFDSILGYPEKKKAGFSQELPKPIMPSGEKLPQGVGASVKVSSPSPLKSPSISQTTISTSPKTTQSREANLELKVQGLNAKKQELSSFEPKIAELNAALQPYTELAKANGGALPPEEFAQYQQLYNESKKLSNDYKLAYNGYKQSFDDYNNELEGYKKGRLGEEKAKIEKLGKVNPLGRIKLYEQTISTITSKIPQLVEMYNEAEQAGDEAAMQKIKLEIDNSQSNIDYMTKAVEGQRKIAAIKQPDTLGNTLSTAIDLAAGTISSGVNFLDEFMVSLSPFQLSDKAKKEIEELNKKSPIRRPSDVVAKVGKEVLKEANQAEEERRLNMPYNGGVYVALKDGNIKDAISNAGHAFTVSLPTSLLLANPITGRLAAAGMAQENVDEKIAENGKATTTDYLVGGLKASTEYVFENMFGTGRQLKDLVKQLGKEGATELVEQTLKGGLKDYAKKLGYNISEESFGEGLTQLTQNAIDIADGKDIDLFDNVPDAALIGLFGGVTQGTATTTVSHYIDRSKLKEAEAAKAKAQSLQEQALEAESPVVAEAIEKEAEKLNDWADQTIEWNNEIGANASPEVVAQLEETNAQIDELEAALPEATPEIAEAITAQIEELSVTAQELAKTAEEQAMLVLEGLKSTINTQEDAIIVPLTDEVNNTEVVKEQPKEEPKSVVSKTETPAKEQEVEVKEGVKFTDEQDKKIKDISIEANLNINNYVKSVPTGRKNKFGNNINEYEATNPFTKEKVSFKKQGDAADYVIKELAKATTKNGRKEIFKAVEELLVEKSGKPINLEVQKPILAETTVSENKEVNPKQNINEKTNDEGDVRKEDVTKDEGQARKVGKDDAKGQVKEVLVEAGVAEKVTPAIKSSFESNIEALVNPETGLAAVTSKEFKELQDKTDSKSTDEVAEVETKAKKARQESILYKGDKDLLGGKKDEWMKSPSKSLRYNATNKDRDALKKLLSDAATSGEMVKAYNEGRISAEDLWIIANDVNSPSDVMKSIPAEILEKGREEEIYSTFPNKAYWKDKTEEIDLSKSYTDIKELEVGDLILTKSGSIGFVKKINPKKLIIETTYGGYSGSDYEIMDLPIDKNDVAQFKKPTEESKQKTAIDFLTNLKVDTKNKQFDAILGVPVALWNTAMDTIILSIKAGKKIHQAVSEGYELVKNYVSEKDFKDYLVEAGISKDNINAPAKEEVKTEGKIAKSGFQERSIEDAKDEVVKKIARENEVYYEVMNQKAEYENALKDFGTLEGVIENYSDLNIAGVKDVTLNEAARLQVKRQVAMQTLSVEIATELAKGNNPTKLNDKVNEIQNALAKDFAKGGQIGAMAIWKFMTPAGIVYQVKQNIKEQNDKKEKMLSEEAKQEIAELNDKVAKLQVKLDEEIAKTAERKAEKAASKPSKGLTEAEKKRKEELKMSLRKKMFGQLNDITNIPKILLDKETIEYAKLIIKEGALDFNSFSKEMIKDFGKLVKPILPKLYTKATGEGLLDAESQKQMEEFMQKEFTKAYGTSKIPVKRKVKADLNKIVEGVESGVLNDNFYKQLFLEKFGMKADLTLEETAELHRLAEAVSSLPATSRLYNIAVMNMAQFINNKYPRTFWSDLADTWVALNYAQMLAGVSTHILNIISTGSVIANSPFRNAINISKWAKSIRMGIKDGSLQSAWVYNPLYEAIYVPSAWAKGVKVGSDIAMSTMMEGAMTDKYVEGLVNMKGKVQVSNLEQNRYGEGKRFRPIRINGVDVNPYNLLKYVGRSLASEDALMFQTAYEAELAGLALSIYREKGLRGKALAQAVTDAYMLARVDSGKIEEQVANEVAILEKTGIKVSERNKRIRASELAVNEVLRTLEASQDQKENIKNLAASATFTDVRNGVISRIARLIASATNSSRAAQVVLKPFVPFTQVVANVTEWMLDSTPVYGLMRANNLGVTGLVNRAMKATGHEGIATAQLGEYKSQAYYEQMARAWQGTIAMAALISIFGHSGDEDEDYENSYLQLTGGYEEETRRNKSGRTKVTPKYTIRIGDKMFTYLNIPPLAIPLALIGNYNDYMNLRRYGKEELAERKGLAFAASVASTTTLIKDMSFIQGTQELLSTLYEVATTEENKVSKAAKVVLDKYLGFATRPLPQNNNLILQIEKFFDPTSYSRKEISDITKYSLGIQHIVGNPSVDILGDAVKSYPAETTIPYTHWFNISKADDDWKFMARYNAIQGKLKNAPTKIFNQKTDKYEERTMDAKEFYDYTVLAGKKFREKVQNYRKNVNADTRVREKEEIGGKEVNGVDYDLNKLHWEAKEEAKAKLFLVKNISDKELNVLREMDNASSLATKQKSEENKKKVIEIQESLNITDQEKTLDISVKEVPKNADELVMDYIKELAPNDKSKQSEISQRLIDLNIITKERRKKIAEAMEFNY